ncbi:hypothetical protein OWR29_32005 [Actinoplanes sp. Pm04-4]|uniref:Uncharacterized protein n=1 Tax=Paractinoplanes pyxinae TaxID=2997416 RepID=A0ABT4B806_9ACTN|nr:hypothetical protein [Actinoplanes pyxinae]MCY1142644.1 hypothetical protein [Actinoplanes pyxinae]
MDEYREAAFMIQWWLGLVLGILGGAVADGTKYGALMIKLKKFPFSGRGQRSPFILGLAIRWACAGVLAAVVALQKHVGLSDQPLVLFLIGLAAPTVVQQATRLGRAIVRAILSEFFGGGSSSGA